jgi:hypothetical protein
MASALYQMYVFDEPLARILYFLLRGVLIGVQGRLVRAMNRLRASE